MRNSYCRFVLFRSNAGVTTTELEQAASQLEKYMSQRFVHAIVRQQDCQRDDTAVVRQRHCHRDDAALVWQQDCQHLRSNTTHRHCIMRWLCLGTTGLSTWWRCRSKTTALSSRWRCLGTTTGLSTWWRCPSKTTALSSRWRCLGTTTGLPTGWGCCPSYQQDQDGQSTQEPVGRGLRVGSSGWTWDDFDRRSTNNHEISWQHRRCWRKTGKN